MDAAAWIAIGALIVIAVTYLVHHLCLWLEARGQLFYLHKKPTSSAAASFVALQQFIEPGTKQIVQVEEQAVNADPAGAGRGRTRVGPFEPLRMQAPHRPECEG